MSDIRAICSNPYFNINVPFEKLKKERDVIFDSDNIYFLSRGLTKEVENKINIVSDLLKIKRDKW